MRANEIWEYVKWADLSVSPIRGIKIGDYVKIIKISDAQDWINIRNKKYNLKNEENEIIKNKYIIDIKLLKDDTIESFYSEDFIKYFKKVY
jgi:hypothetical protein